MATPDILSLIEADCDSSAARPFVDLAVEYLSTTRDRTTRVSTAHSAAELARRFAEPLPRSPRDLAEVVRRLRDEVIPDCNHLYHPRYVGHQVSPPLPAAVWMEPLTAALNQSVAVFEMSPVATVLEHQVIRWLCELAGYGPGAGGTFTTGGTEASFTALLAARAAAMPDAWSDGVTVSATTGAPAVLCGEHAHYAITRAVAQLGLGLRSVVVVPSAQDRFGMDPRELEAALERLSRAGRRIVAVVATAGSTATGSFDDLEAIGEICESHDVWLHVDGTHGASALFSERHRHRVRGIERARSIAWDPHKMMLLPLQAGVLLVRDERSLDAAFSQRAPYLFHGDESERVADQGVRSFLCSRRADVFKLWVALERYGAEGIGALYDRLCDTTSTFYELLCSRAEFEPIHEPQSNILCFRYTGVESGQWNRLDALNRELRERYNRSGAGWITATDIDGARVLRVTIMNPRTTADDLRDILDGIATLGAELARATAPS